LNTSVLIRAFRPTKLNTVSRPLDATDLRLLDALRRAPHASVSDVAAQVGIARGTVYSRVDRLEREGVITGYGPDVDTVRAGLTVLAFTTLEIAQGSHAATTAALAELPEMVEIHTVTGPGDLLCRIVARSNDHLHDVLQRITAIETVVRSETHLALSTSHQRHVVDVVLGVTAIE
jgi:DNA-binding Lrp family transcriptional regulator